MINEKLKNYKLQIEVSCGNAGNLLDGDQNASKPVTDTIPEADESESGGGNRFFNYLRIFIWNINLFYF